MRFALPHGHVAAVLGTLRDIGLDRLLGPVGNRCRDLVIAMIVARLIAPASKLATARMLDPLTAASSLGEVLGLGPVDEDELYVALDWLGERQPPVETALARKHLRDGTLVLYDVSDALEVVTEERRGEQVASGRFDIAMIELPSKERTALVDVVFPELGCRVSLPTSARFSARRQTKPGRQEFDISRLRDAACKGSRQSAM